LAANQRRRFAAHSLQTGGENSANTAQLAELECRNSGKPHRGAEYDIADAATCFEYYAASRQSSGHVNPVPANALSFSLR